MVNEYPYQSDPPASIGWTQDATDLGFVAPSDYASGDIICHKDATNAQSTATVAAGATVTMEWNTWPTSHHGPVIDYLASCQGDCATVDKTALEFFKIDELGLISDATAPGIWATDNLIANNNSWAVTIPSTIASGPYVLRHEIIALHSANSLDGAQNYPQCINIEVTGGGSDVPAGTLGEDLYSETDPGISVNIYLTSVAYTIPGPALYTGGSGSSATASVASATASATSAAVTSAVVSSSPSAQTTLATSVQTSSSATITSAAALATADASGDDDDDTCEL